MNSERSFFVFENKQPYAEKNIYLRTSLNVHYNSFQVSPTDIVTLLCVTSSMKWGEWYTLSVVQHQRATEELSDDSRFSTIVCYRHSIVPSSCQLRGRSFQLELAPELCDKCSKIVERHIPRETMPKKLSANHLLALSLLNLAAFIVLRNVFLTTLVEMVR